MLVQGIQYSFGVTFSVLLEEFHATRDAVAWVGSLTIGFQLGMGVVTGWLIVRFGERKVLLAGGVLASAALVLASFAQELYQLYISYGVVLGIAFSWLQPPAIMVIQRWFVKKRALATAIGSCGSGIGAMVLGPVLAAIIDGLGWRTAFRFIAVLPILIGSIAAFLCRQPKLEKEGVNDTCIKKAVSYWTSKGGEQPLLRNQHLLLLMASVFVSGIGWFVLPIHIVQYGKDVGCSAKEQPMLPSAMGIGLLLGRVPTCWFADWFGHRIRVFAGVTALIGTATCIVTLSKSFSTLVPICILHGWMAGSFVALLPPVAKELVSQEEFPQAAGLAYTAWGWSLMFGPPLVGVLYEIPEPPSYNMPFLAAGCTTILGGGLALCVDLLVKNSPCKQSGDVSHQSCPEATTKTGASVDSPCNDVFGEAQI